MEKIRYFGNWVWLNKERMVLVVMIVVLCYQVWKVASPSKDNNLIGARHPNPSSNAVDMVEQIPEPPKMPPIERPVSLYRKNPFWYYGSQRSSGQGTTETEIRLRLVNIQGSGDSARVKLDDGSAEHWYSIGEPFQSYEVISVDAAEGTCVVYSEEYSKQLTLKLEK